MCAANWAKDSALQARFRRPALAHALPDRLLRVGQAHGLPGPSVVTTTTVITDTSCDRILRAYPTIPRSDDNKDAVIAPISLCPNRGKSGFGQDPSFDVSPDGVPTEHTR